VQKGAIKSLTRYKFQQCHRATVQAFNLKNKESKALKKKRKEKEEEKLQEN
jgi:hypothetical protein